MSLEERSGQRDLLYSRWHRPSSIGRYLDKRTAAALKVIDIDFCEACNRCSEPLALIETQRSKSAPKPATITVKLAAAAQIPAYSVSYMADETGTDIVAFYVRQLHPGGAGRPVTTMDAQQYAEWLVSLRSKHECTRRSAA